MKDICNACGRFFYVHFNARTRIVRTEATLPSFRTVWFDESWTANIIYLLKAKNKYGIMYVSAEGNQIIMVMRNNEVLFNKSRNGLYYHDLDDRDLVLVNMVEENQ